MRTRTRCWITFGQMLVVLVGLSLVAGGCRKKEKPSKEKTAEKADDKTKPDKADEKDGVERVEEKAADAPAVPAGSADGLVNIAVGFNLDKVRGSFLWQVLMQNPQVKKFLGEKEYKTFVEACKVDPVKDIESVVLGVAGQGDDARFVILMSGNFEADNLIVCGKTAMEKTDQKVSDARVAGKNAITFKTDEDKDIYVLAAGKNTLAMASKGLENLAAAGDSSFGNPSLNSMLKGVDRKSMLWGGMGKLDIPSTATGEMGAILGQLGDLKGGNVTVDIGGGNWNVNVMVDAGSAASAKKIEQLINFAKMGLAMQEGKDDGPPKAVVDALNKLKSSTKGSRITLGLSMPDSAVKEMAKGML